MNYWSNSQAIQAWLPCIVICTHTLWVSKAGVKCLQWRNRGCWLRPFYTHTALNLIGMKAYYKVKRKKFSPQNSKHTSFVAIKSFVLAVILILMLIPYNSFHQRKVHNKICSKSQKDLDYLKPICRFSWSFPLFQFIASTVFSDLPLFSVMLHTTEYILQKMSTPSVLSL